MSKKMKEKIYIKLACNILYIVRLWKINSLFLIGMILIPNKMSHIQTYMMNLNIHYFTIWTFAFAKRDFMYILNCWIHP